MRVALISDLHANLVSLEAVLADIDRHGVDEILCLGDVATLGPRPAEVLGTLKDRAFRCITGNHDAFLTEPELVRQYSEVPIVVDSIDWCRNRLSSEDLQYITTFQPKIEVELAPGTNALFFHGSPRSHMEDLLATTDADELDAALGESNAVVFAGGHTHVQLLRQHRGRLLVNPGSTGMPFEEFVGGRAPRVMPWAEYAIIEGTRSGVDVSLKRVDVSKSSLRNEAEVCCSPICRALEQQYA